MDNFQYFIDNWYHKPHGYGSHIGLKEKKLDVVFSETAQQQQNWNLTYANNELKSWSEKSETSYTLSDLQLNVSEDFT